MKYKLKQIRLNAIVHTPTEEEAKELLHILHESGYKWLSGNSLDSLNNPFAKVYYIDNDKMVQFGSLETAIENGCTILPLAEFKSKYCMEKKRSLRLGDKVIHNHKNREVGQIAAYFPDEKFCYSVRFGKEYHNMAEHQLLPYTEPKEELNEDNFIKTENMETKELNLCEILKGHDGETFYSTISGDIKITDFCDGVMKPIGTTNGRYCSDGKYQRGGVVCLFPSRSLYEQYPLDPYTAWMKWQEEQKKFGLDIKFETYFEGKFGWEDCDDNVSCLHFRTPSDRDKCIEEIKSVIEKYSKK